MTPLTILGASLIGLSLGLTGAGGSIITLPVLVYLAGMPPKDAVGMSLFVVGAAAAIGAIQRIRAGEFHRKAAVLFTIAGMIGAAAGAHLTPFVSNHTLMLIFALLMLFVAGSMLLGRQGEAITVPECRSMHCLAAGLGVGILTGFIGVGGGFLLMPALVNFARLPMRIATGTSLAVITFNSASGFIAHLGEAPPRWPLTLTIASIAAAGALTGNLFAAKLPVVRLRQIFAFVVLGTGCYVVWRNLIQLS